MNKLIPAALLALSLALAPTFAHAKAGAAAGAPASAGAHPGQHKTQLEKMTADLGLTDAQQAKIMPIMKAQYHQNQAINTDKSMTPEAKKAKRKALRESTRSQIMPILTPAQKAKMAAMKGHHPKKAGAAKKAA